MLLAGKLASAAVLAAAVALARLGPRGRCAGARRPVLIWAALAASALNVLISAHKWQLLLRRARVSLAYGVAAQLYWIGAFSGNFLPTGVGGDAVRLMLTPAQGRPARSPGPSWSSA